MGTKVEELTKLWDDLFDRFYVLWYTKRPERLTKILNEFKRVGIYQTGKVEIVKTVDAPLKHNMLMTVMPIFWNREAPKLAYAMDAAFNHYMIHQDAKLFEYKRIICFEDDMRFLYSLDYIKGALLNFPVGYNIVLFDKICPTIEKHKIIEANVTKKINGYYYSYDETLDANWSAGMYSLDQNALTFLISFQENDFGPTDESLVRHYTEGSILGIRRAYVKKNLAIQAKNADNYHWPLYEKYGLKADDYKQYD